MHVHSSSQQPAPLQSACYSRVWTRTEMYFRMLITLMPRAGLSALFMLSADSEHGAL